MTNDAIVAAATKMETTQDLLSLLNKIKMSELGEQGHPFIMPHLNYFIHPARNKKNYRSFSIPKKSGGVRTISAPTKLLKSFLTYTNKLLQAFYEAPEYVTGFVPKKSVVDNAEHHVGMNYVFNTDLKDFFPSITKSRVWATLKHKPFCFNDTIADAIAGMCCTEMTIEGKKCYVLPQGSPSSPILTNIVCRNLDKQLSKLAHKYKVRYSRYADDITFSCNRNVFRKDGNFQNELETIITKQNFKINEKKTRVQKKSQRQEVTGLIVNDRVNVTRNYIRDLDNLLYIWRKYGESEAYAKFITYHAPKHNRYSNMPNMHSVIQGKLQYIKMVKGADDDVWRRLQRQYNKLSGAKQSIESATIKYRYTISDFEAKIGQELELESDAKGVLHCFFTLNGQKNTVFLSHYARTRLENILAKDDVSLLEKFQSNYMIIFYEQDNTGFWRIERERKRMYTFKINEALRAAMIPSATKNNNDKEKVSTSEKSTDEVLTALVNSGFDLKTLDEWDKIKSS